MTFEVFSILAAIGGLFAGLILNHQKPNSLRSLLLGAAITGLVDLMVLSVSGALRDGEDFWAATHEVAGNAMLPLIAFATGLWLGGFFPRYQPLWALLRLLFLLLLCFFCLSNTWTGYLGPSRLDPRVYRDTIIRFQVIHRFAVPIVIGTMLLFWLWRLATRPTARDDLISG